METNSLFLSLNNQSGIVPKKIQLIPAPDAAGKITGIDGRSWTLKDPAKLCVALNAAAAEHQIDENHSTDLAAPEGRPSPAVGWFCNFSAEPDGSVWADVDWNSAGQQLVSDRKYRYISPVFVSSDKKEIKEILRAALTNTPNLSNPALNSKMQGEPAEEIQMDKELCAALGLPETASKEDVVAAINARKAELNAARAKQVDLAAYAPRADLNAMEARAVVAEKQLAELNAANLKAKGTAAVDKAIADRKIAPASRAEYIELCSTATGLASFAKIMEKTPELIVETGVPAGAPPAGQEVALNAVEKGLVTSMGYTEEEYAKMKKAGV